MWVGGCLLNDYCAGIIIIVSGRIASVSEMTVSSVRVFNVGGGMKISVGGRMIIVSEG